MDRYGGGRVSAPTAPALHIAGTGTALPGDPVDNKTLGALYGISEEWIDLFVGTRTRHFGWDLDTGRPTHSLAGLCAEAALKALYGAGLEPQDLDFVVLATATPDQLLPGTVNLVAELLGLDQLPTYQLQSGCAGSVQALDLARSLLASGHRTGLVLAGDATGRFMDARGGNLDSLDVPTEQLVNYVLFGDGAGAAVVTAEPLGESVAVHGLLHRFAGLGRAPGQVLGWHGTACPDPARRMLYEDYKAVEESVPALASEILWELLGTAGLAAADVDFLLPPQLSGRMTRRVTDTLGLPGAREVSCVTDTGNVGNALPLIQLDLLVRELGPGQHALAVVVESSKWIKAGLVLRRDPGYDPFLEDGYGGEDGTV
ncbi:3-oxoacyl-ACP synthase III family protein [Streptomyces sp. NPDC097619]|uniref:3-oxoacyl-ACP synthase III family protein n=1 Tax=Streptomyces sp. NPDC097619 TaxID=3157228 RepID=UPI003324A290